MWVKVLSVAVPASLRIDHTWKVTNNWCDMTAQFISPDGILRPFIKDLFLNDTLGVQAEVLAHFSLFEAAVQKKVSIDIGQEIAEATKPIKDDPEALARAKTDRSEVLKAKVAARPKTNMKASSSLAASVVYDND